MRIVRSLETYEAAADLLLSIGVFDGVHLGHRAVLSRLVAARGQGRLAGAMTFERHPQEFLQPEKGRVYITTVDEKINLLAGCGLDVLFLLPFDERIQSLGPEMFLDKILLQRLHTKMLIVGDQWRFGKGRSGDVALAKKFLEERGCAFEAAPLLEHDGEKVSSSRIRALILENRFEQADQLLASPYQVRGIVELGDGRGHVLGVPTANLAVAAEKLIPGAGVYACCVRFEGKEYQGVSSIGDKPTFGGTDLTLETYLHDFNASIYGAQLTLLRWRFLRKQQRFDSAADLVTQMKADVEAAKTVAL
ncbi:MAG: riboflavin biosynthesis protein RibF [Candidatus Eremiobacteraeota bacterium]|nr:riboflavin biosynthesis protein RibF [Candidatus Eremiobacteraeota bacterium]